ncbi:hypothetical protein [Roseibium sp. SCP14]|uniref:hypothetical protein n=1 Tax=Roseibium sp. SCP14 TaxID=3141375 RepID=UPI003337F586
MFHLDAAIAVLSISALMSTIPASAEDWAGLSPRGPIGIKIENAHRVFEQCSRSTPKPSGSLWLPSEQEITHMEQRLVEFFASLDNHTFSDRRWSALAYRGQHVGYGFGSERYIYGAYVRESFAGNQSAGDAILLCDGGPAAWGILFNVETGEFSEFVSNGR